MTHLNDRKGPAAGPQHAWFVEFERELREHFGGALGRPLGASWTLRISETEWRVWLHAPGRHARTISIDLPPNYPLLQPVTAALITASRLRDMAESPALNAPRRAG